jgi:hypothetical protein
MKYLRRELYKIFYKNMRYEILVERALQNIFGNALYVSLF